MGYIIKIQTVGGCVHVPAHHFTAIHEEQGRMFLQFQGLTIEAHPMFLKAEFIEQMNAFYKWHFEEQIRIVREIDKGDNLTNPFKQN